jgi:hypothetical protein
MAASSDRMKKEQSYESITEELAVLQDRIKKSQEGDISVMGPYTYPAALKRIQYLRTRQTQMRKKAL